MQVHKMLLFSRLYENLCTFFFLSSYYSLATLQIHQSIHIFLFPFPISFFSNPTNTSLCTFSEIHRTHTAYHCILFWRSCFSGGAPWVFLDTFAGNPWWILLNPKIHPPRGMMRPLSLPVYHHEGHTVHNHHQRIWDTWNQKDK